MATGYVLKSINGSCTYETVPETPKINVLYLVREISQGVSQGCSLSEAGLVRHAGAGRILNERWCVQDD